MNIVAVLAATVAMFAVGAVWYMGLFAKPWGEMFGFDKLDKATQQKMQKQMGPWYGVQIAVTFISAWALMILIHVAPTMSPYVLAFWLWLGMILPAQVSAVIFGGVEPKWIPRRVAIMAGEALVHLEVAAFVLGLFAK